MFQRAQSRRPTIVVTSINVPGEAMRALAAGAIQNDHMLLVVGDRKGPENFDLPGCNLLSFSNQSGMTFETAKRCPADHYARKNIGYLVAMRDHAPVIIETDDDNFPLPEFFAPREVWPHCIRVRGTSWVNVYRYFTDANVWPRGLPLDAIRALPEIEDFVSREHCPIQQGLADGNPDVDAIFRLVLELPVSFARKRAIALRKGVWCPFNSQNTTWWPITYPLLYLPAYCSFRMTDIWRSFVAQRICWENNWSILFHSATVKQDRNPHELMRDFRDEIPGYLNNRQICRELEKVNLISGAEHIGQNLRRCYKLLVEQDVVEDRELVLLDAWLNDVAKLGYGAGEGGCHGSAASIEV
jgi:hypothetical protein